MVRNAYAEIPKAPELDQDGKLKYEPHHLSNHQRAEQHKQQDRWRQRNSRKTNKAN